MRNLVLIFLFTVFCLLPQTSYGSHSSIPSDKGNRPCVQCQKCDRWHWPQCQEGTQEACPICGVFPETETHECLGRPSQEKEISDIQRQDLSRCGKCGIYFIGSHACLLGSNLSQKERETCPICGVPLPYEDLPHCCMPRKGLLSRKLDPNPKPCEPEFDKEWVYREGGCIRIPGDGKKETTYASFALRSTRHLLYAGPGIFGAPSTVYSCFGENTGCRITIDEKGAKGVLRLQVRVNGGAWREYSPGTFIRGQKVECRVASMGTGGYVYLSVQS